MADDVAGDPRKALAYNESVRALGQQESVLDALRSRTGILLTAISITATFLGSRALDAPGGISVWSWVALGFFAGAGGCALAVLWPRDDWFFAANPTRLLDDYVGGDDPATLDEMHDELARHNRSDWEKNAARLGKLFSLFRLAALLLVVQVGFWLIAIGSEDHGEIKRQGQRQLQRTQASPRVGKQESKKKSHRHASPESKFAGNQK
jgi:hypothetical protein